MNKNKNEIIFDKMATAGSRTVEVGQPILFMEDFKDIPNEFLKLLGLPAVNYEDSANFSFNKLVELVFGVNMFQLVGIMGLTFLASVVMVSIILPSLYFRVMLITDEKTSPEQDMNSRLKQLLLLKQKLAEAETRLERLAEGVEDDEDEDLEEVGNVVVDADDLGLRDEILSRNGWIGMY